MDESNPIVVRIRGTGNGSSFLVLRGRLREIWEYRELFFFLTWRDLKIRYKQTALGAVWAMLQPLLVMVVFSVVFGALVRVPSHDIPYPIFVYCGLVPWQLFVFALSSSANSLVINDRLLTKVYFPRIILPISAILSGLVDFSLAFVVLLVMMIYYAIPLTVAAWATPAFVLLTVVAASALGIGLSALNVRFRDVRHALPFVTQFWFFATPIGYPTSLVPKSWRLLYGLNPMTGVVEGFRWALLGKAEPPVPMLFVSVGMVLVILIASCLYFSRVELTAADVV